MVPEAPLPQLVGLVVLSKKHPIKKILLEGKETLTFWCKFLGEYPAVEQIQKTVLSKDRYKWATTIIHGQFDLEQKNLPVYIYKKGKNRCQLYYMLSPNVDAFGINNGLGILIFYLKEAADEALKAYEEVVTEIERRYTKMHWDEII